MLSKNKIIDNSWSTGEAIPGKQAPLVSREQELEREVQALAELLLDIYEYKLKTEESWKAAIGTRT